MGKLVRCVNICVDCVYDYDLKDAMGPAYLGFDFWVKDNEKDAKRNFIIAALNELGIPFERVYFEEIDELDENILLTEKQMLESMIQDREYIINYYYGNPTRL